MFLCPLRIAADGLLELEVEGLRDLMLGLETDCPPKPFGGAEEFAVYIHSYGL